MDSDEEDLVFVGTPIEREEDVSSRKKKSLAESSAQLRTLPAWKQEVRDEEGRRRFHGAFTGGFSAGFYNTVGSKEGWTPQSFSSSRKNRAEAKKQSVLDFLDEDEKAEMEGHLLGTSSHFDTFGFTAKELARKQAETEQKHRPSAIPGPVPDEFIVPATESIGVKLLLKMGWRHGRSIKDLRTNSLHEVHREARKAFLALSSNEKTADVEGSESFKSGLEDLIDEPASDNVQSSQSTPVYVRQPKQDLYGLGYDPYKHAPEFREMKRSRLSGNKEIGIGRSFLSKHVLAASKSGRPAPGFGIGALEQLDVEDEDIYAPGYDFVDTFDPNDEELSALPTDDSQKPTGKDHGFVPRFRVASNPEYQLERFDPPVVPEDFVARHKFPGPLDTNHPIDNLPPPEVPPPEDKNLKIMIDGVAALVARCGKLFEDISREKKQSNPLFNFLNGGSGRDYYARKLWEEREKNTSQIKLRLDEKLYPAVQKMTAESRGKILGERPLERTLKDSSSSITTTDDVHIQSNLSDTFTKPEAFRELLETAKPFKDDPLKQERFEQFLKDKYQGGLRSTDSSKASNMSEAARAHERLDFEAAAESQKAKSVNQGNFSAQQLMEFTMATGLQFTSGGVEHGKASSAEELISRKVYPKREEFQWRPAPILCKRFDIVDPYMGKPPPAPRRRSKLDSLIFTPDTTKSMKKEDVIMSSDESPMPSKFTGGMATEMTPLEPEVVFEIENVERPVDLYKAIFSDDSDDEVEGSGNNQMEEDPQKKTEAASAAFSRLVAGDFLESLGKELGLEVPPDLPHTANKPGTSALHKGVIEDNRGTNEKPNDLPLNRVDDNVDGDREKSPRSEKTIVTPRTDRGERKEKPDYRSSLSEDERSKRRPSKRRHSRSSSSDDDGDDHRDRYRSRSRDDKRRSSRRKHGRRKHSSKHK